MARTKSARSSRETRTIGNGVYGGGSGSAGAQGTRPRLSFPVVAIGASAGGLAAFTALLEALPSKTGTAFVVVQHLEPKHKSALTNLLSKATRMPVAEVSDGLSVKPDHVYVIPPNKNMTIRNGILRLAPRSDVSGPPRPIDNFAIALAGEQGNAAIGVVLSGTGSDGTYGLKAIKAAGGVTFAQDPQTAQWPDMPISAITAGSVDFVLSPKRIAAELARISRHPYLTEAQEVPEGSDLDEVRMILRSTVGVDFRLYKQATVRRRIARRMALQKIASLNKYAQILKQNPEEAQALADDIFIHVSRFFRDPSCFQALRKRVLAKLCAKRPAGDPLRIWVAGCSTGEEVYSIAMLLLEELGERANRTKIQIFGTDIQARPVEHARAGIYTEAAVGGVSRSRLKRFFVKADHSYQIQKCVRDLCVFSRHDLARDPPFSRLDLISCRNVLIYMAPALQKSLLATFQYALKPGGFLFLGSSESISEYSDAFTAEDQKHRIFLRKPAAAFHEFHSIADLSPGPDTVPLGISAPSVVSDFRREAEGVLLQYYAPPAMVVDSDLHIVHFQGDVSPYLAPASGQPSFHLLKMVRPELVVDLRTAIYKARREGVTVHKDGVQIEHQGQPTEVRLEVRPLKKRDGKKQDLLVVFQKVVPAIQPASLHEGRKTGGVTAVKRYTAQKAEGLERELASTRDHLRALISDREAAQEEMRAANQEILSSNEELQSTNEELETAKEELQSSNEELQHRNTELSVLTRDLSNLLVGVDIPVLALDANFRVRTFTPVAGTLLGLTPADVGRPFRNVASGLDVADWEELFSKVTGPGQWIEREVKHRNGRRYSLRVRPYKTSDDKIDGVLVVLLDTDLIFRARDEAKRTGEDARLELEKSESTVRALVESTPQSVVGVSMDEKIVLVNGTTEKMFGYRREELLGQRLEILVPENARKRHARHHRAYFANMQSRPMGIGLDLEGRRKDGTTFPVEIGLSVIDTGAGKLGVAFVSDIAERKRMEDLLHQREQELNTLLNNSPDAILRLDRQERYAYVNAVTARVAGLPPEAFLGKTARAVRMPEHLCDLWTQTFKRVLDSGLPQVIEFSYPSPGAETIWEERAIPELASDGTVQSVLMIARDITERKRLEQAAQARGEEIQALAASLMTAQEEERRRVSGLLHDKICQQLASLAIDISGVAADPLPEDAQLRLKALQARIVKASEETRHIAYELHPSVLDDLGVVASLQSLCKEFSERGHIAVEFSNATLPGPVPREIASCLYRVARESLENIAKHSRAKHVSVALTLQKGTVALAIEDDGIGFDPEAVKGRGALGLIGMEERARLVNGKLSIAARPGHGTRIAIEIPLFSATL